MLPSPRLLLATLALAIPAVLPAADAFEGRIHIEMTDSRKQTQAVDYAIKDGKIRFDAPVDKNSQGPAGAGIIIDFTQNEMLILIDQGGQKMAMRRPMMQPGATPTGRPAAGAGAGAPGVAPLATGRTAEIAGYPATEYVATGENGEKTELWLAQGLGNFMFPSGGGNPMSHGGGASASPAWEKIARDGGTFPLRAITRDKSGAEKSRFEVTKIERTSLPASLFSADGYTEFKIPGMPSGR